MTTPRLSRLAPLCLAVLPILAAGCGSPPDEGEQVATDESTVSTNPNEHTAYEFFVGKGLKNFQAAAIVGNLQQESNVNPTIEQYGGGPGRGIAQWSAGGRWNVDHDDNVVWYAANHGMSPWSLTAQLDFVWYELTTFPSYGLSQLRASSTLTGAVVAFQDRFEGCGACNQGNRVAYAQAVLNAYGHSGIGNGGGAGCWSPTLDREMQSNACVQSRSNSAWYQCDDGAWVDRWTDPTACNGVYPLH